MGRYLKVTINFAGIYTNFVSVNTSNTIDSRHHTQASLNTYMVHKQLCVDKYIGIRIHTHTNVHTGGWRTQGYHP